ncbi:50S ribosomal protein L11 methyltransferase [Flavihumibacter sp. RY-1]|uniref:Ribosomal protein L11 methyltransferase n=1 Tax=Flavihumibacter fluminis TaxID=2909236 RepID=A0ABS9BC22_9BACT|nr:50S ribosomal protein L11 methyltransferase [Flavihumibacter fluminis]MCF1713142.1 50S ribosomal protein L11 methyltransferase [Flavihumibacter fluminis]
MANSYQQIRIPVKEQETREILIALLADTGYEGFEESREELLAYIPEEQYDAAILSELLHPFGLTSETETIQQRNWNAEWEAGFQPVQVGNFCLIRADFHPGSDSVRHDLIITPKMSFGTGHHATTYQMVDAMQELDFTGKSVLDFGTGTGILAILAAKMGAVTVVAIDNDSWSIENTKENIERNQVEGISVLELDRLDDLPVFDIILANINKRVVLEQIGSMTTHCAPGAKILISGLLVGDEPDLRAAIEELPVSLIKQTNKDSWLCWCLERN